MTQNDSVSDHEYTVVVPNECAGMRLDQILVQMFPQFSRSKLQQWNKDGNVLVNGAERKAKEKLLGGERVRLMAMLEEEVEAQAQNIPLDIIYADEHLIVVNKPVDMVVHPAAGNPDGTLQNALLFHFPELRSVPRAGIVHRLDKDTTGLLVVARTLESHTSLVAQLQARTVKRQYLAIAAGEFVAGGTIKQPIGRHPRDRKKMAVVVTGKEAITHFRVVEQYRDYALLQVNLETGRTHQIRVHFSHSRHPLLGDLTYGSRLKLPRGASEELIAAIQGFRRQALHAEQLQLTHPATKQTMRWEAPLPDDYARLIDEFERDIAHQYDDDEDDDDEYFYD